MKISFFRTYFSFSKAEKNGLLVLLTILLIIVVVNLLLPVIVRPPQYDFASWEKQLASYQRQLDSLKKEKTRLHPFPFNPNKVSFEELLAMGISEKPAANWTNYLQKGGHFRKADDIAKIYGLSDSICKELIPFIQIEEEPNESTIVVPRQINGRPDTLFKTRLPEAKTIKKNAIPIVDLNHADSVSLVQLPGIGPVLAGRIIKYRQLLGGYYSVEQLKEVYGMRNEHIQKAVPFLKVTSDSLKLIQINFASLGELARHPYISYKEAKAVVNKREKEGKIKSFDVLSDIFLPEKVEKLQPYIIFAP